jgi:hypothetical protein
LKISQKPKSFSTYPKFPQNAPKENFSKSL